MVCISGLHGFIPQLNRVEPFLWGFHSLRKCWEMAGILHPVTAQTPAVCPGLIHGDTSSWDSDLREWWIVASLFPTPETSGPLQVLPHACSLPVAPPTLCLLTPLFPCRALASLSPIFLSFAASETREGLRQRSGNAKLKNPSEFQITNHF